MQRGILRNAQNSEYTLSSCSLRAASLSLFTLCSRTNPLFCIHNSICNSILEEMESYCVELLALNS